ncbi:succinate dehydrogenase%2C hydrophobic membrane anchor protein [Bordetella ansorpii]|uniref:Succinate dehydrogenase, hydrophobic membrane anchor protein n=1 Tax=Bordetella ansorpii TaxID=288768 RepID=A0A157SKA6_9BORD|nr:succinate dehydrogenase [Bordetella ansorpii]SAI70899.1 succinate dehydrogenase%2C hydrophobic membrane anchor protein [Bordetella ansorpii]
MENLLFVAQRLSAMVMGPFVLVHLGLILYAVRGGLTAGEILQRTQGNPYWLAFYTLFVVAAAVHAPIGVRNVLVEWTGLGRRAAGLVCTAFGVALLALGLRAVAAVGGWLS